VKILIAPDSFKESLSALEVAANLQQGLKQASSDFEIEKLPMADGGEGTVDSLVNATDGQIISKKVTGPLGEGVEAQFGILGDKKTGVIEMAAASGLSLIPAEKRDPGKTTTYGTGELIKAALDKGCRKLIIGIGGSATNDCGVGMAQALGGEFLTAEGKNVGFGGANLAEITQIDLSSLDDRLAKTEIEVACDVDNPLYGEKGAAYVYAPQKGASSEQVKELDKGLKNIVQVIKQDLDQEIADIPGAGAAGGLGAGLLAFLEAKLRSGSKIVTEAVNLKEKVKGFDLVITGEGMIDAQTVAGKAPIGVARVAKEESIPVIGVAGTLGPGAEEVYDEGIDVLFSIVNGPMKLEEALNKSAHLLTELGRNIGKMLLISQGN
jgi:glycerate kinase